MTCTVYDTAGQYSLPSRHAACIVIKGNSETFSIVNFPKGSFLVELWGASSGYSVKPDMKLPGKGGYVSAVLSSRAPFKLYFYIGTAGTNSSYGNVGYGGYNGGANGGKDNIDGNCAAPGSGGSTDIRIKQGDINTRIIVAGAGGSPACGSKGGNAGDAGGLVGFSGGSNTAGTNKGGQGGNQTYGYRLWQGEEGISGNEAGGSGGSGYYGGFGGQRTVTTASICSGGGGGGSSYIASIYQDSQNKINIKHPVIIDGRSSMPTLTSSKEIGHIGNGIARITRVGVIETYEQKVYFIFQIFMLNAFVS